MHNPAIPFDLLIVFGVSTAVVILFHFLRQPSISGFILSGALIGPYGLSLISSSERISTLAELGVVLLLFSLGIEFSFKKIASMARAFFGLGLMQCVLTTGLVMAIMKGSGFSTPLSFVAGAITSLSSTALVLKLLQHRRETATLRGRLTIAVLLFQDLWIIPLMIITSLIGPEVRASADTPHSALSYVGALVKALALLGVIFVLSRFFVGRLLALVARTRIRELFLMSVFLISVGIAAATAALGLSLALGAFLAGVIVSDSDYGHQAVADVVPLREPFLAIFFVSVGALLDPAFLLQNVGVVVAIAGAIVVLKFVTTAVPARILGYNGTTASVVALSLAQIGEFSLVLAGQAHTAGIITDNESQYVLSVTLVLLCAAPFLFSLAPRVAPALSALDLVPNRLTITPEREAPAPDAETNHVIVVGFGHNGENLCAALARLKIPFQVLEINPDTVKRSKARGVPIRYGDASRIEVLETVHYERARMVVVTVGDADSIRHVVESIRRLRPELHIVVRAQYVKDLEKLAAVKASDVIVGELETGLELLSRVLLHYGVPPPEVQSELNRLQSEHYRSFRQYLAGEDAEERPVLGWLSQLEILPVRIEGGSIAEAGHLGDLHVQSRTGAIIAAVYREGVGFQVPDAECTFEVGDIVYAIGELEAVNEAAAYLRTPVTPASPIETIK